MKSAFKNNGLLAQHGIVAIHAILKPRKTKYKMNPRNRVEELAENYNDSNNYDDSESLAKWTKDAFKAGYEQANKDLQEVISELQDKLYHATREAPEIEYKLGHEIETLREKIAVAVGALEKINSRKMSVYLSMHDMMVDQIKEAREALAKVGEKDV